MQIFTLNTVNSPPAALIPTTFDSKYIIHESFIDNLWTQRSNIVHICKDNDNIREDRKHHIACYPLREGHAASHLCQLEKPFLCKPYQLFVLPASMTHIPSGTRQKDRINGSSILHQENLKKHQEKYYPRWLSSLADRTAPLNIVQSRRP